MRMIKLEPKHVNIHCMDNDVCMQSTSLWAVDTYLSWLIIVVITLLVDYNRITLPSLACKPGSDYINGNYIKV